MSAKARKRTDCIYVVGSMIGVAVLSPATGPLELPAQLALFLEQSQTDLGTFTRSITAMMPDVGVDWDWSRFETEWEGFKARIPEFWKLNNDGREFKVGEHMRDRGLRAKYPVVIIPGIVSTSLESWSTSMEYRAWFREKVWGGMQCVFYSRIVYAFRPTYVHLRHIDSDLCYSMLSQVTFNKEKWMASVMLDPQTGLDPEGIKVRAAQGTIL